MRINGGFAAVGGLSFDWKRGIGRGIAFFGTCVLGIPIVQPLSGADIRRRLRIAIHRISFGNALASVVWRTDGFDRKFVTDIHFRIPVDRFVFLGLASRAAWQKPVFCRYGTPASSHLRGGTVAAGVLCRFDERNGKPGNGRRIVDLGGIVGICVDRVRDCDAGAFADSGIRCWKFRLKVGCTNRKGCCMRVKWRFVNFFLKKHRFLIIPLKKTVTCVILIVPNPIGRCDNGYDQGGTR